MFISPSNICFLSSVKSKWIRIRERVLPAFNSATGLYPVLNSEFSNIVLEVAHSDKRDVLSGIINDFGKDNSLNYLSNIKVKCDYTISYLKKIGFEWPDINEEYIVKYIEKIK